MGWGGVDPAPPAPINTLPKGEETKEKKGEAERRDKHGEGRTKDRRSKPTRKRRHILLSLYRGEEAQPLSSGFPVTATATPPRTVTNITVSSAI
jgi:hypothetical protein